YLVFSGVVVNAGNEAEDYAEVMSYLAPRLSAIGINRSSIVCTPGNHDLQSDLVKDTLAVHDGVLPHLKTEDLFNQNVNTVQIFKSKFKNYSDFEKSFAAYGVGDGCLGQGYDLDEGV
ncbi:hypothetical protein OEZ84_27630, partial [Leclercia adecarboxylata]|uniref:hypothetical protein n=1 Tax=Leclercia adecarboxylata TaxID=83655 RepID=UPI00234C7D62